MTRTKRGRTADRKLAGRIEIETFEPRHYCSGSTAASAVDFAAPKTIPHAENESGLGAMVTGDFGNGHPDLAVLNQGKNGSAGSIQVFLNNGKADFTLSQTLTTGSGSQVMQAVDLYGNGHLDLIVSNAGDGTLDVFAGNGNGSFSTMPTVTTFGPQEVFSGSSVFSDPFQVGALLGAGSPNGIVIADQYDNQAVVLQLDANQQLNVAQTIPIPLANFVLVDTTGDDLPDIVQTSTTDVTTFTNLGGTFSTTVSADYPLGLPADYAANYLKITTGDFAGNGMTDLAVPAQPDSTLLSTDPAAPGQLSVLMAQPGGGFAPAVLSNEPADDRGPVAADVNSDNVVDLITQSANSSDVLLGNDDGTFVDQNLHIPDSGSDQFAVADFNGDGTPDIVTSTNKFQLAFYANKTVPPGTGSTALSPIVTRTTLPPQIVAGSKTRGTAFVSVTNTDPKEEDGTVTTAVYASSDGLFDDASVLLGLVTRKLVIKPGASTQVVVPIKSLPASLNGIYMLLAQTTNYNGIVATETGPSVTILPPFISFSETFVKTTLSENTVSGQKSRATMQISVTNNGNVISTGKTTIAIYVTADGSITDGTLVRMLTMPIVLRPAGSRNVTLPLQSLPAVVDGSYFLVTQLTDPTGNISSGGSPGTYGLVAPVVALVPAITTSNLAGTIISGSKINATVSLTITNNGNVPPSGSSTVTIYASVDGTAADGTSLASQTFRTPIAPTRFITKKFSISAFSALPSGSYFLVVVVTDPLSGAQTAVSTASYTVD